MVIEIKSVSDPLELVVRADTDIGVRFYSLDQLQDAVSDATMTADKPLSDMLNVIQGILKLVHSVGADAFAGIQANLGNGENSD